MADSWWDTSRGKNISRRKAMRAKPLNTGKLRASVRGAIGTAVAVPLLFSAMPTMAQSQQDEMQDLRDQIQQMQQRMDEMQQPPQAANAGDDSSMVSKSPDGEGFMVGDTRVEINGYIKADAIYDFEDDNGVTLGPYDAIDTLDAEGTDRPGDANLGFTAKQTRLKLSTNTPTAIGDVGGYIEMDFFGEGFAFGDTLSPRIRRAYLTVGNWLIGRDWTTFSDFNYGTTLNFWGPQGQIYERQAQIRYSMDAGENTTVDFALENPGGGTILAGDNTDPDYRGVQDSNTENVIPDMVVRLKSSSGPFSFQAAAIGRYLSADVNDGSLKGDEDSTLGYGLDLGGSLSLPTGTTLMLTGVYGEGIGKYLFAPYGGADAYVTDDGKLEAFERYTFIGTISQELTSTLTTNVIYGKGFSEDPDDFVGSTGGRHDESSSATVNLLYTPVDPLTFGIEYDRVDYERISDEKAHAQRVQVSAIYNF
jgi:hypothetical protein